MDTWKTAPFELGGGEDACLLLHGFTGSPWDMRPLGEALAARGLYVKAPRLPGHGTTPEALLSVTHCHWEKAAQEALWTLRERRHVFVAGLSMGALLALRLAVQAPERVRGLALIAPAISFTGMTMRILEKIRRHPLLGMVKPWVTKGATDISDPVARAEAPVLPAFPMARLDCLFNLQAAARADVSRVRTPTLVAVAELDHVVDPQGGAWLARHLVSAPMVRLVTLREGYHIIPRDTGGRLLASEVVDFVDRLRAWQEGVRTAAH
jgi:carboxylesterase